MEDEDEYGFVTVRHGRRFGKTKCTGFRCEDSNELNGIPMERIEHIIDRAVDRLRCSKFWANVLTILENALNGRKCSLIHAIGIGNFCKSTFNGCDQLALLLIMKIHFKARVTYREPLATRNEKEYLNKMGINVIDAFGSVYRDDIHSVENDMVFYFAPHCGHDISESVIYSHRDGSPFSLSDIILIGNNLHSLNEVFLQKLELNATVVYRNYCECYALPIRSKDDTAFNHSAVHYMLPSTKLPPITINCPLANSLCSKF